MPKTQKQERYPALARWIRQSGGWAEIECDDDGQFLAMAVSDGEGTLLDVAGFDEVEEALQALDAKLAHMLDSET